MYSLALNYESVKGFPIPTSPAAYITNCLQPGQRMVRIGVEELRHPANETLLAEGR